MNNDPIITLTDQLTGNPVPIYYFPEDRSLHFSGSFGRNPECRDDHGVYLCVFRWWGLSDLAKSDIEEGVVFSNEDGRRLLDLGSALYRLTNDK